MTRQLNEDDYLKIAGSFEVLGNAVSEFANAVVKAMQPVLQTITALLHNAEFQVAVIEALEKKLSKTPEADVAARIELQAQIKTWRKYQKEGTKNV